jgi:hypothetical protein
VSAGFTRLPQGGKTVAFDMQHWQKRLSAGTSAPYTGSFETICLAATIFAAEGLFRSIESSAQWMNDLCG